MALENEDFKGIPRQEHGAEAHSFDNLAREVAEGTISRDRVLKLIGAAFLGGLGALTGISAFADDADARRRKKKRRRLAPVICPGQGVCPPGFIGNSGCCPATFPICCPASVGGGCCPATTPVCGQTNCFPSLSIKEAIESGSASNEGAVPKKL